MTKLRVVSAVIVSRLLVSMVFDGKVLARRTTCQELFPPTLV
jgi:hypothetical protein